MNVQVQLIALGFQALVTLILSLIHLSLGRQGLGRYHLTWSAAWLLYAARLVLISFYVVTRNDLWLFAHQTATGITALLILWASLQFARQTPWRTRYLWFGVAIIGGSALTVFALQDIKRGSVIGAVLLSAVTLWTAAVFYQHWRRERAGGALVLAATFAIWGLHHLDYPLLRFAGEGVLYGVFVDVVIIVAAAVGTLALVLGDGRRSLAARTAQLEQLTRMLLRAQEAERHRIGRELHDSVGQVLTAARIDQDLGRHAEAGALVQQALQQIRDVSALLRPAVLEDLGLEAALVALADDFERRTGVRVHMRLAAASLPAGGEMDVAIYRIVQEALTNVARHAGARSVNVSIGAVDGGLELARGPAGRAPAAEPTPHLGLLGMRERIAELGGRLVVRTAPLSGFRLVAWLPGEARS
jgi:signal transduction histidine kinase